MKHQSGFVNIFGKPNSGKSTLMNALVQENLAIISPKVQTTRHRIIGIINEDAYQIILSDTPGIIDPKYRLQEKMMTSVKSALEDADVALLMTTVKDNVDEQIAFFKGLRLKATSVLLINKMDLINKEQLEELVARYKAADIASEIVPVSALQKINLDQLMTAILKHLPENPPFYPKDTLTDRPMRFFVAEMIREKIFHTYREEIPYHSTVIVTRFEEKENITVISADIVVQRETQKIIILGKKGSSIKQIGIEARKEIEEFIGGKVFLELFVKVRPKWREKDNFLREYGYDE